MLAEFANGAEWIRADFHLHTLKEPGQSRSKFRAEFRGSENEFAEKWVSRLETEGIRLAVITNHNFFDVGEFKALRKRARKKNILVLPGIELGVNAGKGGIHTLIVFSPEWVDDQSAPDGITRFLSSQFNATPDEGSRTTDDLAGCLEKLDGYGKDYFVVFAHVESDNGLFKELDPWGQLKHVIDTCGDRWQRVLGLQKVISTDYIKDNWPGDTLPAFVEGSDPRDSIEEVGKSDRSCWLKIGDMSFESLRFALTDHLQRVSCVAPIQRSGPLIYSVRFEGGLLDMNEYGLSAQLTTLIGSRGSGKSAVIECLRYALDFQSGKNTDSKYKDSLVKAMLANGGEVIVTGINEHNQPVEVRRPLGFEPQVVLDGENTRLHPRDVFPNVLYFGQKEI